MSTEGALYSPIDRREIGVCRGHQLDSLPLQHTDNHTVGRLSSPLVPAHVHVDNCDVIVLEWERCQFVLTSGQMDGEPVVASERAGEHTSADVITWADVREHQVKDKDSARQEVLDRGVSRGEGCGEKHRVAGEEGGEVGEEGIQ